MTYALRELGRQWGFDCSTKLTAASAKALASTPLPKPGGRPGETVMLEYVWRYVFFGPALRGDIDRDELVMLLDHFRVVLLVQHCRAKEQPNGWLASAARGAEDGKWAAENAFQAGYMPGAYIELDMEDVANPGIAAIEHAEAAYENIRQGGFPRSTYVGFDCGMTSTQLYGLKGTDRYHSDAGNRQVAVRGCCCKQHPTILHAGVQIDPDEAYPDALGGSLVGMGTDTSDKPTDPDLPKLLHPDEA